MHVLFFFSFEKIISHPSEAEVFSRGYRVLFVENQVLECREEQPYWSILQADSEWQTNRASPPSFLTASPICPPYNLLFLARTCISPSLNTDIPHQLCCTETAVRSIGLFNSRIHTSLQNSLIKKKRKESSAQRGCCWVTAAKMHHECESTLRKQLHEEKWMLVICTCRNWVVIKHQ